MVQIQKSQISKKCHRFQQTNKKREKNVQRKGNWKKQLYSDFARHICIFVHIYVFFSDYKYPIFCK